nr:unnamed protein product [Callosobruchus analis]
MMDLYFQMSIKIST